MKVRVKNLSTHFVWDWIRDRDFSETWGCELRADMPHVGVTPLVKLRIHFKNKADVNYNDILLMDDEFYQISFKDSKWTEGTRISSLEAIEYLEDHE